MNGVETIRKIKEIDASIKILLSSGHLEREKVVPKDIILDGTLPKPFRMRELALKVRQVLSAKTKS
jgi:DNA-binding response OmpR family regulator